jgi:hypothetical protein
MSAGTATFAAARQSLDQPGAAVLDLEVLDDICGDDAAFRDELLSRFGESCALLLPRMFAAARAGDAAPLGETAHQLRSAALTRWRRRCSAPNATATPMTPRPTGTRWSEYLPLARRCAIGSKEWCRALTDRVAIPREAGARSGAGLRVSPRPRAGCYESFSAMLFACRNSSR